MVQNAKAAYKFLKFQNETFALFEKTSPSNRPEMSIFPILNSVGDIMKTVAEKMR